MQGERQRAAAWRSPLPVFLYTPLDGLRVWWRGGVARLASECGHSGVAASRLKPPTARAARLAPAPNFSRVPRVLLHLCERRENDRPFVDRERQQRQATGEAALEPVGQVVGADSPDEGGECVDSSVGPPEGRQASSNGCLTEVTDLSSAGLGKPGSSAGSGVNWLLHRSGRHSPRRLPVLERTCWLARVVEERA